MASGKPYVGPLDELPLLWNPYSPFLAWLITPVLRLFRWSTLAPIALVARLTMLTVLAVWVHQLARFARVNCPGEIERRYLALALLWVMMLFSANIIAVRPDLLSFLLEFMSLVVVQRALRDGAPDRRFIALAGMLAGLATGVKLNTVGGATGIAVFLLLDRRYISLLLFAACAVLAAGSVLALEYAVYGPTIVEHVILGLQSQAFHGIALARRSLAALDEVFVLNLPFFLLAGWGLLQLRATDGRRARLMAFFMAGSLCVASLGQSKIGAGTNYFIGAFMAGAIPLAVGARALFAAPVAAPYARALRIMLGFTWIVLLLKAAALPVTIFANDARHYPYDAVNELIIREFPRAVIYTRDENAALRLHEYAPLGPWSESLIELSAGFTRHLPSIRRHLAERPFTLAVATGSGCDRWRPGGVFERETVHLSRLAARLGKICVFAPALSPPATRAP